MSSLTVIYISLSHSLITQYGSTRHSRNPNFFTGVFYFTVGNSFFLSWLAPQGADAAEQSCLDIFHVCLFIGWVIWIRITAAAWVNVWGSSAGTKKPLADQWGEKPCSWLRTATLKHHKTHKGRDITNTLTQWECMFSWVRMKPSLVTLSQMWITVSYR